MNIIIDTLGNDLGTESIIFGCSLLLKEYDQLNLILVGEQNNIDRLVEKHHLSKNRIMILEALETIRNDEDTIRVIFDKPNSSVLLALRELKNNDDSIGLISTGKTGSLLIGSMKYLKDGDIRPCLSVIIPNDDNSYTCLVDAGSTVDCSSQQLHEFAILGSSFMKKLLKIEHPRVALLSNGEEAVKGNKVIKETHLLLKEDPSINFIGNIEPTHAFEGGVDVLVADGFIANQVIKSMEGMANRIIKNVYQIDKDIALKLKEKYEYGNLGGGIFLGLKKYVIKCHGSSNEYAILNTGKMLMNLYNNKDLYNT